MENGEQKAPFIHYLRDEDGKPFACIAAVAPGQWGWSICCEKDQFSRKIGRTIAIGRAEAGSPLPKQPYWAPESNDSRYSYAKAYKVRFAILNWAEEAKVYFEGDPLAA